MSPLEILAAVISVQLAIIGWMGREYYQRIERHLVRLHQVYTSLALHELRLERVETKVFGRPWTPEP